MNFARAKSEVGDPRIALTWSLITGGKTGTVKVIPSLDEIAI